MGGVWVVGIRVWMVGLGEAVEGSLLLWLFAGQQNLTLCHIAGVLRSWVSRRGGGQLFYIGVRSVVVDVETLVVVFLGEVGIISERSGGRGEYSMMVMTLIMTGPDEDAW